MSDSTTYLIGSTVVDFELLEDKIVVVKHGKRNDAGICKGVMPGRKSGNYFDKQPKLILVNNESAVHIPIEDIKEIRKL